MKQLFRLLIFLIQPYVFRATNSPILRSTFWLYIQLLVKCTDIAADRCHGWDGIDFHLTGRQQCRYIVPEAVYTVKKCSWGWANLSSETCRSELKRLMNEKIVASCWLFTSLYQNYARSHKHHASLGFYTVLIKIYSDFLGDSELPLSRYKSHQVPPPPPLRRSDWAHISPTALYNRRIPTGCFLQHPLEWIVTLKKEAVRSSKI